MKEFFCNPKLSNNELLESLSKEVTDFYQYSQKNPEKQSKEKKEDLFYVLMRVLEENKEKNVS